ncbi:MAG: hypothetical protein JST92_14665 [Deltaproteobacteria bacterium]|nr:hypothetical protein [Deltaproteobacteria bacterium]
MTRHGDDILARLTEKGAQLREVNPALLRQRPGESQRWFRGPDGCDLFLWSAVGKGLVHVQLTVVDRAVEWKQDEGVRTARLASFHPSRKGSELEKLTYDREVDPETMTWARALLQNAPIDDVTRALVVKLLGLR